MLIINNISMESFFATYYLDLQNRIKTAVAGIRWIEQDYGQDSSSTWRPSIDFPAVLIDFPSADYEHIALGGTTVKVEVSVRLLVAVFSQSHDTAPNEIKNDAMQYFEIEHELTKALHGWQPDDGYAQPLMIERATTSNHNDKGIRVRILKFTTQYDERSDDKGIFKITPPKWQ